MSAQAAWSAIAVAAIALPCTAVRADAPLPPRSEWHVSSSSTDVPEMSTKFAVDGDPKTRWGGAFSANHWLQLDFGRAVDVGGVVLRWDSAFAKAYQLQASDDGTQWRVVYETADSQGGVDYDFFPHTAARYLRLASLPRTADWGVSLFEFEPVAAQDTPRIEGLASRQDAAEAWSTGGAHALIAPPSHEATHDVLVTLPHEFATAGLEVTWSSARRNARLEARGADGAWRTVADDPESAGTTSYLAARESFTASALRLRVQAPSGTTPAIARLRLLDPSAVLTPLRRYQVAASRNHAGLFPATLHDQQVYWTVVGIPAGRQKSLLDEYGNVEPWKGSPLVQAVWHGADGRNGSAYSGDVTHALRDGWMPLPSVEWSPAPDLRLRTEAFAVEQQGAPVTLVRYRVSNTSSHAVRGTLSLLLRPLQINPPWQHGGTSPIRTVAIEGPSSATRVRVNGRVLFHSLTPVGARGAAGFGTHGEYEITRDVARGAMPSNLRAEDADGLAAAALSYPVRLRAGETRDVVIAFPLGAARIDTESATLPAAPELDRAALLGGRGESAAFDALADATADAWQARLGKVDLSLPDASLVQMLRAQTAYMLLNQSGPALQPGPRNYNRSFIRDGSATAVALLRMGVPQAARDYLHWYATHAVHENGLVSPILNEDGSVNRGFGSDLEYDSQGEFLWLVAEIARLDGGAETVREYAPQVRRALHFLQELRQRTLAPGYLADRPAPERFRGILAPSISHEGYAVPTHSYWDDYWGLKGWHDGAWLAEAWGDAVTADWAREQYAALRDSVAASLRATMAWKGIDFIPASADAGDGDPSGVSIALDPCGQQDLLPADALSNTFTRYLADVKARDVPGSLYAYTPYELRNILTYVHLNRPQDAQALLDSMLQGRRPAEWQEFAEVVHSRLRHPGYVGDMPHTWIGSEYVRTILGMLLQDDDDRLELLSGTPPSWVAGPGLRIGSLATSHGTLSYSARTENGMLTVTLGDGLRADTRVVVRWPDRQRPAHVVVDGRVVTDYTAEGVTLERPFRTLQAGGPGD